MLRDDTALIAAAKTDPEAFAALYKRHYSVIFAFIFRRLRDRADAEDATAQTFINAWLALGRYEERGRPFVAWLLRIAANQVFEVARHRQRSMRIEGALLGGTDAADVSPEHTLQQHEQRTWIISHLDSLTPDQRRAVWLHYYEDRSIAEVAARLGRSEGASKALLWRSLKALRKQIEAESVPMPGAGPRQAQHPTWAA